MSQLDWKFDLDYRAELAAIQAEQPELATHVPIEMWRAALESTAELARQNVALAGKAERYRRLFLAASAVAGVFALAAWIGWAR